jgi:hypothetical protein
VQIPSRSSYDGCSARPGVEPDVRQWRPEKGGAEPGAEKRAARAGSGSLVPSSRAVPIKTEALYESLK